jgi:enolase
MPKIEAVKARRVLDSRGNPTVECEVRIAKGWGRAIVPSGASTGSREALELRDGDKSRYLGRDVSKAVANVNTTLAKALVGQDVADQADLDARLKRLDGTANKSKLGANALLGVSLAFAHAQAAAAGQPLHAWLSQGHASLLPLPLMNFVNGGAHADNNLDFQEIMVAPMGAPSFSEAIRMGSEIFHSLKGVLKKKGLSTNVGDEGGFAPEVTSNEEGMRLVMEGIEAAGYTPGREVALALDVAASEFHSSKGYQLAAERKTLDAEGLVALYEQLVDSYPIVSIEDGMAENDWSGWKTLTQRLGSRVQLVGDDLFVTDPATLREGIKKKVANAILLKVNQIGTLSETQEAARIAKESGYGRIVSHRSGETEDATIAHLAVAWETGQIKTGSLSRSDRIAKYNELLRIEEALGTRARYAGASSLVPAPAAKAV